MCLPGCAAGMPGWGGPGQAAHGPMQQRAAAGYAPQAQQQQDMLEPLPVDFGSSSRHSGAAAQPYQVPAPDGNSGRGALGAQPQVRAALAKRAARQGHGVLVN